MHARLDILEKNGVDYPRTWDAFVETCKKIQQPPFYGFGMDLGLTADATDNIMQLCWCFGGRTYDADGNAAFDNEGNAKGFAFINDMYNKHKIIPKGVVGNGDTAWNNKAYQSIYDRQSGERPQLFIDNVVAGDRAFVVPLEIDGNEARSE
jgi:ABC-type glycerol-3-phosphate transport system substrate-binding protein